MAHENVSKCVHLGMVVLCHLHWMVFATFVTDAASNLSFHSCTLCGNAIRFIFHLILQLCYL